MCPFFSLSFWYRESITLSNWDLVVARIYCHTLFQLLAHSQWILHNCSLNLCYLQYTILISWFSLHLVVSFFVFTLRILFPLTLLWIYLGVSCFALHILTYQIAVLLLVNTASCFIDVIHSCSLSFNCCDAFTVHLVQLVIQPNKCTFSWSYDRTKLPRLSAKWIIKKN